MSASTIQFTGEQARGFADISAEAWRHWRKVVPALGAKRGKKARFSAGELVALSVIATVVRSFDVGVGSLAAQWDEFLRLCAAQRPSGFRSAYAVITAEAATLVGVDGLALPGPAVGVPCEPIVERLWTAAFSDDVPRIQTPLPFAPHAVTGRGR